MAVVREGEYQNKKTIVIQNRPDSQWPFNFGQSKAKLIVECMEQIKHFAETGDVLATEDTTAAPAPVATPAPAPAPLEPVDDDDIPF